MQEQRLALEDAIVAWLDDDEFEFLEDTCNPDSHDVERNEIEQLLSQLDRITADRQPNERS